MHMAIQTRPWTRAELDRLPDDGNRYEVLEGELFVTPAPSDVHQELVAWLSDRLTPFVVAHRVGRVHHPRSVIVIGDSQLEPDLMARPIAPLLGWDKAPTPILGVEVLSRTTRQRDLGIKREFYLKSGIPEYWVVSHYARTILRLTPTSVESITDVLTWRPPGVAEELRIHVQAMFDETLTS